MEQALHTQESHPKRNCSFLLSPGNHGTGKLSPEFRTRMDKALAFAKSNQKGNSSILFPIRCFILRSMSNVELLMDEHYNEHIRISGDRIHEAIIDFMVSHKDFIIYDLTYVNSETLEFRVMQMRHNTPATTPTRFVYYSLQNYLK